MTRITKRKTHLNFLFFLIITTIHFIFTQQQQQVKALNERDEIYFGIWPNTESGYSDTPNSINQRLAFNVSTFQIAQAIPLPKYNYTTGGGGPAPEYLIEQTQTDAAVFLTVYPTSIDFISDDDLNSLGNQLKGYTNDLNRTVFLRFAPEMQGTWNPYGFQPTKFLILWRRMFTIVKSLSPATAIVWAPNTPQSYPYGQSDTSLSPEDLSALDTNRDGRVTNDDDPFMPYYPGDDFVDWIGLSTYYKGPNFQNINVAQTSGYCASVINGTSPTSTYNWYDLFCNKPGKACMITESGAAFHVSALNNEASTARTYVDLQRAWWQDCITSTTLFQLFPRLKLTMHFEHEKLEMDGGKPDLRDYRLTNDTETLNAFKSDLTSVLPAFVVAGYRPLPANIPVSGRPEGISPIPGGQSRQPQGIVFQTHRNPPITGPPTLFGRTRQASSSSSIFLFRRNNNIPFLLICIFVYMFF